MITKNHVVLYASVLLCLLLFAGCSKADILETANELQFSLAGVSDITISYDEEDITFYDSNDDYLPLSYQNNLTITTTDGNINLSDIDLNVSDLRIDSTSGTVQVSYAQADQMHLSSTSGTFKLGSLTAESIWIKTTSENVMCKEIDGSVTYTSTSGNAEFQSAIGFGRFTAENSGRLSVCYTNVNGDLTLFNKNDNINLVLPEKLEFEFEAITKNGAISTNFPEQIEIDGDKTIGTVGDNPTSTVRVETKNGNITAVVGICH